MKVIFKLSACALALLSLAAVSQAALKPGAPAPMFKTEAALAGKPFAFDLAQALRKGPVVLYFFPKAFTKGCTIEAHAFAEAMPQFSQMGATVIGVSHDDIGTLEQFSTEACRDRFPVASDTSAATIGAYDAGSASHPGTASRISYVIDPQGKIMFVHEGSDPLQHVELTLQAVRQLHDAKP